MPVPRRLSSRPRTRTSETVDAEHPAELIDLAFPRCARGRAAFMLVKVGSVLEDIADARLAASGLDARDYSMLAILSVDGPGSQHEIARLLGTAPGMVVAAVDHLEGHGLVERNRDPQDRRRSVVTLTDAGREALARADELANQAVAEVLHGLGAEQLASLRALLEQGVGLSDGPTAVQSAPRLSEPGQSAPSEPAASSRRAS